MSTVPALNEDQLETLAIFLEDHAEMSDGLDFFALHGLLTANVVTLEPLSQDQLLQVLFDGHAKWKDAAQQKEIENLIQLLQNEVTELIESGQPFPVPCDLNVEADEDNEAAPLENWAVGFMLLSMVQTDLWYSKDENTVAEVLFPILYASGLHAEDDAFAEIDEDDRLSAQVCEAIPDAVIDLFLHYHSTE